MMGLLCFVEFPGTFAMIFRSPLLACKRNSDGFLNRDKTVRMMGLTLFCEFRGTFATLFQSPLPATEILTAILEDNNLARLYVSIYLKRMWTECCALLCFVEF